MAEKEIQMKSYGSIPHLSISKLNQKADKKITMGAENILTVQARDKKDLIIVTEKVDGSNVAVLKKGQDIIAIQRAGYDVRTSEFPFLQEFHEYVQIHRKIFKKLLNDGERLCGEWMTKVMSLEYNLPHEPFVAFDLIDSNNRRTVYTDFKTRCDWYGIVTAGLVHIGGAISIVDAMTKLGPNGFHGCLEQPEGVVYRLERNGKVETLAKFVREHKLDGLYMDDETKYNKYVQYK